VHSAQLQDSALYKSMSDIIIIIIKWRDYGGVLSEDCADTEQSSKKVRETVLRTRNCQTRPKLSCRIASSEQFSLQVPLKRWQQWWRGHRGRQAVPHSSRHYRKSAVANGGEVGEGYGECVRGRRAETPTSVQIGNAMEVTGKVGWSLIVEAAVHQHCQFELDPLTNPEPVKIA